MKRTILITGGAGFIGSHVVRLFVTKYPDYRIVNLDKLTYAGNLANLRDIEDSPNYVFEKGDICDFEAMRELFRQYGSPSRVRTSWARSRCSRRHGNTGTVIGQASCSTTSPPTRCTGRWS